MSDQDIQKKVVRRRQILACAVFFTLLLHITALFLVKDMQIALNSYGPGALNRLLSNDQEELMDEEEELAELFEQLTKSIATVPEPLKEEPRSEEPVIMAPLPMAELEAPKIALEMPLPPVPTSTLPAVNAAVHLPELDIAVEVHSDPSMGRDLLQATDCLQAYASSPSSALPSSRGGSIASSSDFDVVMDYAPKDGGQYVFRLRLYPKAGVRFKHITNNVFFVIDRSHSIEKERFEMTQRAVAKALEYLSPQDSFNLLVFDKNVSRFSENPLPVTRENILQGQDWLYKQKSGGIFASTELYGSLDKIIPSAVADTEVNTAILFSDGDTYLKQGEQRASIAQWTLANQGKVSLFSVTAGKRNNLPLLEVLSRFNKGWLAHAPSNQDIEDTLLKLIQMIRNPIGKEMVATAVTENDEHFVTLLPSSQQLPELYEDTPYVLYGSTNCLKDFHLFVQGKYYSHWLDIKQTIAFDNDEPYQPDIAREWARHEAYHIYDQYISDGKERYLKRANQLLNRYQLPTAFR